MEASLERSEVQNDINSSKYPRHRFLDTGILSTSIHHKGLVVIQVELRGCMEASVQRSGLHDKYYQFNQVSKWIPDNRIQGYYPRGPSIYYMEWVVSHAECKRKVKGICAKIRSSKINP